MAMIVMLAFSSCLMACGKKNGSEGENTPAAETAVETGTETATETNVNNEEPYGLTIAYFTMPGAQPDQQMVFDEINKILLRDCNVYIDKVINLEYSAYMDQISLMMAGGEKLDAFCCNANNYATFVNNGQLTPMEDILEEYGQDIIDVVGRDYLKAGFTSGHQYGLTTNRDLAQKQGFLINVGMAKDHGIDYEDINTIEEFGDALGIVREKSGGTVTPYYTSSTGTSNSLFLISLGVDPLGDFFGCLVNSGQDEDLEVVNYFATEEYMQTCRLSVHGLKKVIHLKVHLQKRKISFRQEWHFQKATC